MQLIHLPATALNVSPICLGTGEIGTRLDRNASFRLLDAYVDAGGNFLDTAHVYGDWVKDVERSICEKTIGAWLQSRANRARIVLATKGGHPDLHTMNVPRLSRAEIIQDIDESLQFLQTDVIDLYWLHRDDPLCPSKTFCTRSTIRYKQARYVISEPLIGIPPVSARRRRMRQRMDYKGLSPIRCYGTRRRWQSTRMATKRLASWMQNAMLSTRKQAWQSFRSNPRHTAYSAEWIRAHWDR